MATCNITTGAAAYENCAAPAMGLKLYDATDGFASLYPIVAARNTPPGVSKYFPQLVEACLRARGILYFKTTAGDCGTVGVPASITSGQIVGLSGTAASGVIGGLGVAGTISGAATFGIGTAVTMAVGAIESIFTHHAQAVANEQRTICSVANWFNTLLQKIDLGVQTGTITADQGISYVKQVALQAINGLRSIEQQCNAACYYIAVLNAHIDFVNSYYPAIAPIPSWQNAPGAAPSTYGTPPGGVADSGPLAPPPPIRTLPDNPYAPAGPDPFSGAAPPITSNRLLPSGCRVVTPGTGAISWVGPGTCSDNLNPGYRQPSGQDMQRADVPVYASWITLPMAILALAFVLLLVFLK